MTESRVSVDPPAPRPGAYLLPLSDHTRAVALSLASGHQGGDKVFVAAVRFLGEDGDSLLVPYKGFDGSKKIPAYFYVKGGKADAPITTTYRFATPPGAVAMEIKLHPWDGKEDAQFAAVSALVTDARGEPRRPAQALLKKGSDAVALHFAAPPMVSQIAALLDSGQIRIADLVREDLRGRLGEQIVCAELPFDSYDKNWNRLDPSRLMIDVAQLPQAFGWKNTLTLRDPAATIEMVIILEMARAAGVGTMLVRPEEPHHYPLLPRVTHLCDITLKPSEAMQEKLVSSHR